MNASPSKKLVVSAVIWLATFVLGTYVGCAIIWTILYHEKIPIDLLDVLGSDLFLYSMVAWLIPALIGFFVVEFLKGGLKVRRIWIAALLPFVCYLLNLLAISGFLSGINWFMSGREGAEFYFFRGPIFALSLVPLTLVVASFAIWMSDRVSSRLSVSDR